MTHKVRKVAGYVRHLLGKVKTGRCTFLRILWLSKIQPILEYGSAVWTSFIHHDTLKHINFFQKEFVETEKFTKNSKKIQKFRKNSKESQNFQKVQFFAKSPQISQESNFLKNISKKSKKIQNKKNTNITENGTRSIKNAQNKKKS